MEYLRVIDVSEKKLFSHEGVSSAREVISIIEFVEEYGYEGDGEPYSFHSAKYTPTGFILYVIKESK